MVLMFVLFVAQFSISAACLSLTSEQEMEVASLGWSSSSNETRREAEVYFYCCGFHEARSECEFDCCMRSAECRCNPCSSFIRESIDSTLSITGVLGLLFSFIQFLGVWLTIRYRNLRDPAKHPSAFL